MAIPDFFSLLDLPFSLNPNPSLVKKKYYALSKQYHPDRFAQATEMEQQHALEVTSALNDAMRTLSQPDVLLGYILRKAGVVEKEESYNLPPDFLMEMMDLNEQISDYEMQAGDEETQRKIVQHWEKHMSQLVDALPVVHSETDVMENSALLKDIYYRKKYLLRIKERINTFAAPPN